MAWSAIAGQRRVQELLHTMWTAKRLPHAMMFHGPEGSGKSVVAIELAKVLNCERGEWNACDVCPSCQSISRLQHPRLRMVFPLPARSEENGPYDKFSESELERVEEEIAAKASNPYYHIAYPGAQGIKISSIREILHEAALRNSAHGTTVALLLDAHLMNASAANALLKTLEEPRSDLMLILCTSRREGLLPTIVSRCQMLRFDPVSDRDAEDHLLRTTDCSPEEVRSVVRMCEGNLTMAHSLLGQEIHINRDLVLDFMRAVMAQDPHKLQSVIHAVSGNEKRPEFLLLMHMLQSWIADVVAVQQGAVQELRNADLQEPIEKFARYYPNIDGGAAMAEIDHAVDLVRKNAHLALVMTVLALHLRAHIVPQSS